MKFYLVVMIALLAFAGCNTTPQTAEDKKDGDTAASEKNDEKSGETGKTNASPKDAIAAFVDAIEAKDGDAIKAALSEKTNKLLELQSKITGKTVVDFFASEEFEDMNKMPETRNEKIEGEKATIEVKGPKDEEWTPIECVKEGGSWKVALADKEYEKEYEEMTKRLEEMDKSKKDGDGKEKESDADSGSKPASDS
ncbi:MAG: DUF2950 family protein [Pyrinomonadaceae bacterium]|nr:DUF2950 family protein [Pyrinomonadaceae bacterium]